MNLDDKYKQLKEYIKNLESVAVAFSSGVDSTFLLKTAYDVLKNNTDKVLIYVEEKLFFAFV